MIANPTLAASEATSASPAAAPAFAVGNRAKDKALHWPIIIFSLLGLNVVITAALITYSSRDPGLMVESDYDQRALQWDAFARKRVASDSLGWTASVAIETSSPRPRLIVRLTDRDGKPVSADSAEAIAFPQSHASKSQVVTLKPVDDGIAVLAAPIVLTHPGLWEIRLTAKRDGKTFMSTSSIASDGATAISPEPAPESTTPALERK